MKRNKAGPKAKTFVEKEKLKRKKEKGIGVDESWEVLSSHTNVIGEDSTVGKSAGGLAGKGDAIRVFPWVWNTFLNVACVSIGVSENEQLCWTTTMMMMVVVGSLRLKHPFSWNNQFWVSNQSFNKKKKKGGTCLFILMFCCYTWEK